MGSWLTVSILISFHENLTLMSYDLMNMHEEAERSVMFSFVVNFLLSWLYIAFFKTFISYQHFHSQSLIIFVY